MNQQWEFNRALRVTLLFLLICVLTAVLGTWATAFMVRSLVRRVPREWEQRFGDRQMAELEKKFDFSADSNAVARLTVLAAPLLAVVSDGRTQFRLHILDTPNPNAFALPGGHIIVTTGMLRIVSDPDELLGVMAHELAHVTLKHGFRRAIAAAGPLLISRVFLGSRNGILDLLSRSSALLAYQSFSQQYEMEADSEGWGYLVKANVNPRGMIDIFRTLQSFPGAENEPVLRAFSSHPTFRKRIARLESMWDRLPRKSGFLELTNSIPVPKVEGEEAERPRH